MEMSASSLLLPGGGRIEIDEKGYLLDSSAWTPEVARTMAAADGVVLESDHWSVIRIFRDYYGQYDIEPPMRALVRMAKEELGEDKGSSRYLYRLFPDGPGTQGCRYAGLPRPVSCV
jgi:tRNA 2-thiouridine synthesizing protein E